MALFAPMKIPKGMTSDRSIEERLLAWPDSYYNEREADIRKQMLDAAIEQKLSPEEDEIRRVVFGMRYPDYGKKTKNGITRDAFLGTWLSMRMIGDSVKSRFSVKSNQKKLRAVLKELGLDKLREQYGKKGEDILCLEIYHMAKLYMHLCNEDKQYCSVLLGLGRMKDQNISGKISEDAWKVAYGIPQKLDMVEECAVWTKAIDMAYRELFPDSSYFENRTAKENGE